MLTIKDPPFCYVGRYCEIVWKHYLPNEPIYKYFALHKDCDGRIGHVASFEQRSGVFSDRADYEEYKTLEAMIYESKDLAFCPTFTDIKTIRILPDLPPDHPSSYMNKSKCKFFIDQSELQQFAGMQFNPYSKQWFWF